MSVSAWMAYVTVVSVLLAAGAAAVAAGLRPLRRPQRWPWVGAVVLSLVVPAAAYVSGAGWAVPVAALPDVPVFSLPPLAVTVGTEGGFGFDVVLAVGWAVGTLLLGVVLVASWLRLRSRRRGWERAELHGVEVWRTADVGPAVYGWRGATILLPAWVWTLEQRVQKLLLLHEREHVRAGDARLLLLGLVVVLLQPWNVALWWVLWRLRLAVEVDCDARVLRAAPDAREYGGLLLEVGRRRASPALLVAFSEPRSLLERRIRRMTEPRPAHPLRRAVPLGAVGVALMTLAVCARDPMAPQNPMEQAVVTEEVLQPRARVVMDGPQFTPFTVEPRLLNPEEIREALQRSYPPLLRDAGIGGTATVWLYIEADGRLAKVQLNQSSGYAALDEAALSVAKQLRFSGALNRGEPVAVWISIPISFSSAGTRPSVERLPSDGPASAPERASETPVRVRERPVFTPFTTEPRMTNPEQVREALQRNYPPLLRDAGIGGTARVWFFIEADGSVSRVRLNETSGYDAFDQAALEVADAMRFRAAENRGSPVAAWISIPVTFTAR